MSTEQHIDPETVYVLLRGNGTIAGIKRDPFEPPRGSEGSRVVAYTSTDRDPEGQEYVYRLVAGDIIWPTFSEDEAKRIAKDPRFRLERAPVGDWERV